MILFLISILCFRIDILFLAIIIEYIRLKTKSVEFLVNKHLKIKNIYIYCNIYSKKFSKANIGNIGDFSRYISVSVGL